MYEFWKIPGVLEPILTGTQDCCVQLLSWKASMDPSMNLEGSAASRFSPFSSSSAYGAARLWGRQDVAAAQTRCILGTAGQFLCGLELQPADLSPSSMSLATPSSLQAPHSSFADGRCLSAGVMRSSRMGSVSPLSIQGRIEAEEMSTGKGSLCELWKPPSSLGFWIHLSLFRALLKYTINWGAYRQQKRMTHSPEG